MTQNPWANVKRTNEPLLYSPVSGLRPMGVPHPCMASADAYRKCFPEFEWMFNPYSGTRRHTSDIESDPHGLLIDPDT